MENKNATLVIPGLPTNIWNVRKRGKWFTPMCNGRPLMTRDGKASKIATFHTLVDAQNAALDFVARMQN